MKAVVLAASNQCKRVFFTGHTIFPPENMIFKKHLKNLTVNAIWLQKGQMEGCSKSLIWWFSPQSDKINILVADNFFCIPGCTPSTPVYFLGDGCTLDHWNFKPYQFKYLKLLSQGLIKLILLIEQVLLMLILWSSSCSSSSVIETKQHIRIKYSNNILYSF